MHCLRRALSVVGKQKFAGSAPNSFDCRLCLSQFSVLSFYQQGASFSSSFFQRFSTTAMSNQRTEVVVKRYENIVKSAEDKRVYRGLELTNGLRVLLISDEKADKSAASMDVNVGHLMDPWELPGLAHFCEHMLFLGTNKYPSENEYSKFISSHGGSTNAFTASDHTNYHFDIAPEHLTGALDRFVQFFLCPQFTESATEREVCAVDSENSNNLQNDTWRIIQLERSLSKPGHDYGKFGTGNKKTLLEDAREKGIEPREALLNFHKEHYSSDIMSCCIIGNESLDELENIVVSLGFGDIEKKNRSRKVWTDNPYGENELACKIEVVPVKDLRHMTVDFSIPDYREFYRKRPTHYLSHLIGHEGPGSLLSELKRRGWVSNLSAGQRILAKGMSMFSVSVDLSEEGLEHTEEIVNLIFHEIGLVKSAGPLRWVQDELRKLAEIKFRFKDKENPMTYVTHLASNLQLYPVEDVVYSDYRMDQFSEDLINELLSKLTPDNMYLSVVSQKFGGKSENVREKWYQTEYNKSNFDKALLSKWQSALESKYDSLTLPTPNEYIATKFDLKERITPHPEAPRIVRDDKWMRLWFMQDQEYNMPKSYSKLSIYCPMISSDPMNSYLSLMFIITLQDALAEETYNPFLAGLNSSFNSKHNGLTLKVTGYDEKQCLFARDMVRRLINFVPDEKRYDVLKENICRSLRCFRQTQPYSQSVYYTGLMLSNTDWTKEQLLACAEVTGVDRLARFVKDALQAVYLEMFVYGNMLKKEVLESSDEIVKEFESIPGVRPLFASEISRNRTHVVPTGSGFVYKESQNTHENSAVDFIMQTGPQSSLDNVLLELIVQLAAEPAFNQLRTNEQLGYIVHTSARRSHGTQALHMLIQGKHDPEFVFERIEAFLLSLRKAIETMSEEEFRDNIEALAAKRLEKPKTLSGRAARHWDEIASGFYHFNRVETEVPLLRGLTKQQVLAFFDKHFGSDSPERRRLCTMVYAETGVTDNGEPKTQKLKQDSNGKTGCMPISNIDSFKSSMALYPLPQPVIDIPPLASMNKGKM